MGINEILDLFVKYGINNAIMIYLLYQFVQNTKYLATVIEKNTVALTKMEVVIERCNRK